MNTRTLSASALALSFALSFGIANAQTALSVSCSGAPTATNITWTGTTTGGVAPLALLWGNGGTSTSQSVSYTPGTYSMTFQATDASSSVATSTCSATVVAAPAATTSATSTSNGTSIQDQIQALLQQIATLKQQIGQLIASQFGSAGSTTPPVIPPGQVGKGACISLSRDVSEGDSGGDVRSIQEMLASDPAYGFTSSATGFFGPITARAMARYQEMNGIASSSTGFVGPLTRGFFERECGKGLENSGENSQNGSASSSESETPERASNDQTMGSSSIPSINLNGLPGGEGHGNSNNGHGDN